MPCQRPVMCPKWYLCLLTTTEDIYDMWRNSAFINLSDVKWKICLQTNSNTGWLYCSDFSQQPLDLTCLGCEGWILFRPDSASFRADYMAEQQLMWAVLSCSLGCLHLFMSSKTSWILFFGLSGCKNPVTWDDFNNEKKEHSNSFSIKFYWKVQVSRLSRWCVQFATFNLRTHFIVTKRNLN